ncbi:34799_t:CDS:1, partial [Racocetra persica]
MEPKFVNFETNIDEFIGIDKEFEQCLKSINSGNFEEQRKAFE